MKTAIYTRVSTDMQVEEGFSLDAQLARLRAYCDSQGWNIIGIYTDNGESAKNTDRPELQRMLSDIRANKIDCVLVYKLDRLTRSVLDLYELLREFDQHNCKFKSATEVYDTTTAIGRLFITLVAALAQWERENIAERSKFGQIEMTRQGRWSGGHVPFGYDYLKGELIINEMQARVVREIFNRYTSGDGMHKLLHYLNNPDHPQPAPRTKWTQPALKYVLRNPLYAGYVRYGYRTAKGRKQHDHIVVKGNHEAIIDKDVFDRAQKIRMHRATLSPRSGTGSYPLTGVLKCGLCGSSMSGTTHYKSRKDNSVPRRYYVCVNHMHSGVCSMKSVKADVLEELMLERLETYYDTVQEQTDQNDDKRQKERESILKELNKIEQYESRWMDAFQVGDITSSELRKQLDKLYADKERLKILLEDNDHPVEIDHEMIAEIMKTIRSTWDVADVSMKKELIRTIVDHVEVMPGPEIEITYRT